MGRRWRTTTRGKAGERGRAEPPAAVWRLLEERKARAIETLQQQEETARPSGMEEEEEEDDERRMWRRRGGTKWKGAPPRGKGEA